MAAGDVCVVCGCDIALLPGKAGRPVRHAGKMYCGDCAELVLDQSTSKAADEIELNEIELTEEPVRKSGAKMASDGIEVVEEFNIKAVAPAVREKKLDDDDWFKQSKTPNSTPVASSGRTSGVKEKNSKSAALAKAEPERRSNSRAMKSAKGSGRMPAAKPAAAVEEPPAPPKTRPSGLMKPAARKQDVDESLETHVSSRKSSRRMSSSGRSEKASSISRNRMPAAAKKPNPEAEEDLVSEPPEASAEVDEKLDEKLPPAGKMSSRTFKVDRRSAKSIRAQEREDRESRKSQSRSRSGSGSNSNMTMIGLGVGGVVLLLLIVLLAGGAGDKKGVEKKAEAAPEINAQSPSEFAARAKIKEDRGDRLGAADDYQRAAEASGNSPMATQYNMHAYQLRKFTTLNMGH